MDIFTILVFFLMVNSSDVEVLETSKSIKLPDSQSEQRPEQRIVISVSRDNLVVQGRQIVKITDVMRQREPLISRLKEELDYLALRKKERLADPSTFEGKVTIMGDRELPYELLKRIMYTCQQADFTGIALAVTQVGGDAAT
jgi:biopolymer transport protein ExbD